MSNAEYRNRITDMFKRSLLLLLEHQAIPDHAKQIDDTYLAVEMVFGFRVGCGETEDDNTHTY